MMRIVAAVVFFFVSVNVAQADVRLVQVPVACGTIEEVYGLLHTNMPKMSNVGKGSNANGHEVAVLFAGAEHWALIATMTADQICVVASGRNWTDAQPETAAQF